MPGHEFAQLTGLESSTIQAGDRYANNYISGTGPVVLLNSDTQTFEQVQQLTQQLQDLQKLLLPAHEATIPFPPTDRTERISVHGAQEAIKSSWKLKNPGRNDKKSPDLASIGKQNIHAQKRPGSTSGPYFIVPYDVNDRFIERSEEIETLFKIFDRPDDIEDSAVWRPGKQPRAALYGLGGVGKTQLAIHFVHRYHDLHPGHSIFWVHASTDEWLRQSFQSIADKCNIDIDPNGHSNLYTAVGTWLKASSRTWLLVLDNVDDADVLFSERGRLANLVAGCPHGAVLATTRDKRVAEKITKYGSSIPVKQMSTKQCIELMKSFLSPGDFSECFNHDQVESDLQELSRALEYLPLALAQAAAYIRENSISPKEYLDMFNSSTANAQSLLDSEFEAEGRQHFDTDMANAVGTTLMFSLDYLRKRKSRVGEALMLLSFLQPTNILPALLLKPEETLSHPSFVEMLGDLQAFSILLKGTDGLTYTMHRLVHHAICKWRALRLSSYGLQPVLNAAVRQIVKCFETKSGKTDRGIADLLLPHALQYLQEENSLDTSAEPRDKVSLMRRIAEHLLYQGRVSDSADLRGSILEFSETHAMTTSIEVLRSKCELAEVFEQLHRFEAAQRLCNEVVDALGSTDDRRQTYINALKIVSRVSAKLGDSEHALENAVLAKKVAVELVGEYHESALIQDFNTAEIMRYAASSASCDRDQLKAAKALLQDTISKLTALKGENDSLTVLGKQHLANVLDDLQEFDASILLSEEIVASKKSSLGDDHLETFQAKLGLGLCFMKRAQLFEAESLILQALEHSSPIINSHHLGKPKALQMLAMIHEKRAEQWKSQSRSETLDCGSQDDSHGTDHLYGSSNPAIDYERASLNEYQTVLDLQMEVASHLQTSPGIEHPHTLKHMIDTSRTCMQLFLTNPDDFKEGTISIAEQFQRDVLAVQSSLLGNEHPDTVNTKGLLLITLREKGSLDEADQLATEVYKYRAQKFGKLDRATLDMQQILAEIMYDQPKKREVAVKLILKCFMSTLEAFGEQDEDTSNRLAMLSKWRTEVGENSATPTTSRSTWRMLDIDQEMKTSMSRPVAYHTVRSTAPICNSYGRGGSSYNWRSSITTPTDFRRTKVVRGFSIGYRGVNSIKREDWKQSG